ncbi:MAG: UvrD-helicase domain-containing protein, partial [Clostridiales bacterium]|nr:UvrD-helicase domain-containing protein [Clostridiales bacterium]
SRRDASVAVDEQREEKAALKQFFAENVRLGGSTFTLDDEQLAAVLTEQNTLITARAGAGKTRVLIAKLIYLFEQQHLDANNVLAFCFNRDASVEISERLNNKCLVQGQPKYREYDVAKTFHAFSRGLLGVGGKILTNRTKLIKMIINDFRKSDPTFSRDVYRFFRKDTLHIDRKNFYAIESYYKYMRNSVYVTLCGEKVKSKYEKYIADYLFEHGNAYVYEKSFYPYKISFEHATLKPDEVKRCVAFIGDRKETVPDFYLPEYNTIWEHWAVTGNESAAEKESFENLVGDYDEYLAGKDWKRKFWSKYWRKGLSSGNKYNVSVKSIENLIETTSRQLNLRSREEIEAQIERILRENKIYGNRLPEKVLINTVWDKCIDGFTVLIDQFINKLEQNYFDDVEQFVRAAQAVADEKTRIYYQLGYRIYRRYIEILARSDNEGQYAFYNEYDYDFNQIIYACSQKILRGEADDKISKIRWILIDEYQDFSRLFDYLIDAILQRNGGIRLFCVGDDWQAINRFAGSDIKYFRNFANRYPNAKLLNITTNYRSENHIVQFANKFMNRCGVLGSRPKSYTGNRGISTETDISETYIGKFDDNNLYLNLLEENEHNKVEKAQYLKACRDIIQKNPSHTVLILSRSNTVLGKDLEEFEVALKALCLTFMTAEEYARRIFVKTVHRSKGEEADTVILLNVNEGVFPVFHSNNDLFEVFGQTTEDAVEDEEKLYYVALTRAKHNLHILYEAKSKSPFIMS